MNYFVCVLRYDGRPLPEATRNRYPLARSGTHGSLQWENVQGLSCGINVDDTLQSVPVVARWGSQVGIGIVRVDNRLDLIRSLSDSPSQLTDLQLVVRFIAEKGEHHIGRILGDYAFILWNYCDRRLLAACDTFAVRRLYYKAASDEIAFASRAEVLGQDGEYDQQYFAELLAYCSSDDRTPFKGVLALPAASIGQVERNRLSIRRYWSAHDFGQRAPIAATEADMVAEFRHLHAAAVQTCLANARNAWAHLSGGLDSSSVVCMAQWLASRGAIPSGLAGTLTVVDSHGTGADEREYSGAVVQRYGLRNEIIDDAVCWQDDEHGPPFLDQPCAAYPFYARDRRMVALVREAGGRVLLTGIGGDNLVMGNMFFFADWIASGNVGRAVSEMLRRAAIGHVSFWELAFKNGLLPNLPGRLQRALIRDSGRVPAWVTPAMTRAYDLGARALASQLYAGRLHQKYFHAVAQLVNGLPGILPIGVLEEALEVRHPYLYRPLVEFALMLPPDMCARPHARKWILREAMRDILPEPVRTRVGKGVTFGLLAWSLVAQRERLARMLEDPILAQMGCIDLSTLQKAFHRAQTEPDGPQKTYLDVQYTLAIEAWLNVRSGRWAARECATQQ
jgi:asparagine synthase (glutamine-hydrolysing)